MHYLRTGRAVLPALGFTILITAPAAAQETDSDEDLEVTPEASAATPPTAERDRSEAEAESGTRDRLRFRGGIALIGGAMIFSEGGDPFGVVGFQGQLGVQINDLIGVYAVPELSGVFGDETYGGQVSGAIMVDFTPLDMISAGIGFDSGVFGVYNEPRDIGTLSQLYGARLRVSYQPVVSSGPEGRSALRIGLDLRLLLARSALIDTGLSTTGSFQSSFLFAPMVSVGYLAF
ncbi:MAG: hypothetical protein AAGN82_00325 [Myxococcota bacterium]